METNISLFSLIFTGVGVLATIVFSFLLWKATKNAADTARATLELSKELYEREEQRQKEFNEIRKKQLARQIWRESEKAYYAIVDVDPLNILNKLESAPSDLHVDKEEIIKYFPREQVEIIFKAWDAYIDYKEQKQKLYEVSGIAVVISQAELDAVSKEVEPIVLAFSNLENMIKYQVLKEAS
ncbi:hypothetical protein HPT25_28165 [Bacillus sp. BRMEA1]|uniref:hypothetical protein n=1 Tax=Neobacillus endophyticus TaxID=2738405 RepID=UPI0015666AD2|nr:hypothetical protein [Neobacillus endophyticus]NRD81171.1 hypothetical protein [Neobacillus endophyticus]